MKDAQGNWRGRCTSSGCQCDYFVSEDAACSTCAYCEHPPSDHVFLFLGECASCPPGECTEYVEDAGEEGWCCYCGCDLDKHVVQLSNVKVVYPYDAYHPDELSIRPGDNISQVQWNVEGMWSQGTCKRRNGLFPSSCIQECDAHMEYLRHRTKPSVDRAEPEGNEGRYAGKDYLFMTTFEEHYLCAICRELASDATQSMCCGQSFCRSCIELWQAKKNSCPMCRQTAVKGFKVFNDVRMNRFIQGLQLICPNFHMGCNWEGELRGVQDHLTQVCLYAEVACPNGCDKTFQRYVVNVHLQECTLRKQACVFCEQVTGNAVQAIPYLQLIQSHYKECPYVPMRCPNNCGVRELQRSNLANHLEVQCLKEAVACEFSQFGCQSKVTREDMSVHLQTEVHTHLSLLMRSYCSLHQEVQRLKKRVQ